MSIIVYILVILYKNITKIMKNKSKLTKKLYDSIYDLIEKKDKNTLLLWCSDIAEHVLPIFEKQKPSDERPKEAIHAARDFVKGNMRVGEARNFAFKAHEAAREAENDKATFAARSCGHAIATAHVLKHAIPCSDYAAKAAEDSEKERQFQYDKLMEYISRS